MRQIEHVLIWVQGLGLMGSDLLVSQVGKLSPERERGLFKVTQWAPRTRARTWRPRDSQAGDVGQADRAAGGSQSPRGRQGCELMGNRAAAGEGFRRPRHSAHCPCPLLKESLTRPAESSTPYRPASAYSQSLTHSFCCHQACMGPTHK